MLGLINNALKAFVIDTWGEAAWAQVVQAAGVEHGYVSSCPYADGVSVSILSTVAEQQGMDLGDVLEEAGFHFNTKFIQKMGYDRLLRCMGGNLVEFLQNLNVYHLHLSLTFKDMQPPAFNVSEVTADSLVFRYASPRPGLTRFAVGLIRGAALALYDKQVAVTVIGLRSDGSDGSEPCDHDRLLVTFPEPETSVLQQHSAAHTCRLGIDPPSLFTLFPFHMVLDSSCRLVQVGKALSRMYPGMKPGRLLSDFFTIRHPYIDVNFDRMTERTDSTFILRSRLNGMEIKGQVTPMSMPKSGPFSAAPSTTAGLDSRRPSLFGAPAAPTPPTASRPPSGSVPLQPLPVRPQPAQPPPGSPSAAAPGAPPASPPPRCPFHGVLGLGTGAAVAAGGSQQQGSASRAGAAGDVGLMASTASPDDLVVGAQEPPGEAAPEGQLPCSRSQSCALGESTDGNATAMAASAAAAAASTPWLGGKGMAWGGSVHSLHMLGLQASAAQQEPVVLFLGTPRIGSVDELRTYGLYVSDLPLFDNSREMVLMAEQHTAEAALKDTFERLSLQLEEERRRSDALLYQMIPPHIADTLRHGERAQAETYPECTILFSDIVGFTTIAAGSTAMEVCRMLDALYNEFDALLELDKYSALYKVETIGDAYMLVANVTKPCHNHVDVMLDFALDMHRVCSRVRTNQDQPIQIRIGIHSGSVVGGVVGRRMPRFTLFGDTVNTASRMESHGLPGSVHMSAASRALLRDPSQYLVTERGEIAVKGKGLMETFLVSRASAPTASHLMSLLAASASNDPEYQHTHPNHRGGGGGGHHPTTGPQIPAALQLALASILSHSTQTPALGAGRGSGGHSGAGSRAARTQTGSNLSVPGSVFGGAEGGEGSVADGSGVQHQSESVLTSPYSVKHRRPRQRAAREGQEDEAEGDQEEGKEEAGAVGYGGFGSTVLPADEGPTTSLTEGVEGFSDGEHEREPRAAGMGPGRRVPPASGGAHGSRSPLRHPHRLPPRPDQLPPSPPHALDAAAGAAALGTDDAIMSLWMEGLGLNLPDNARAPSTTWQAASRHHTASGAGEDASRSSGDRLARSGQPSSWQQPAAQRFAATATARSMRAASVPTRSLDGREPKGVRTAVDASAPPYASTYSSGAAERHGFRAGSSGSSRPQRARVGRLRQPSFYLRTPPPVTASMSQLDFGNAEQQLLDLIHELQEHTDPGGDGGSRGILDPGAQGQPPQSPPMARASEPQYHLDHALLFGSGAGPSGSTTAGCGVADSESASATTTGDMAQPPTAAASRQRTYLSSPPTPPAQGDQHQQQQQQPLQQPRSGSSGGATQHVAQLQALLGLLRASNSAGHQHHNHAVATADVGAPSRQSTDGGDEAAAGGGYLGRRAGSGSVRAGLTALGGPLPHAAAPGPQGVAQRSWGRTRSWGPGRAGSRACGAPQDTSLLSSYRVAPAIDEREEEEEEEGGLEGGVERAIPSFALRRPGMLGGGRTTHKYDAHGEEAGSVEGGEEEEEAEEEAEEEEEAVEEEEYVPRHRLTRRPCPVFEGGDGEELDEESGDEVAGHVTYSYA